MLLRPTLELLLALSRCLTLRHLLPVARTTTVLGPPRLVVMGHLMPLLPRLRLLSLVLDMLHTVYRAWEVPFLYALV